MMTNTEIIKSNWIRVNEEIKKAADLAGVKVPKLVVVTKKQPIEVISAVIQSGAVILGENYPEEAEEKIKFFADEHVEWHMIGNIQSRKAEIIAKNFSFVHSLDRYKVAHKIDQKVVSDGKLPVLLELNVSGEMSKSGIPAWEERHWADLLRVIDEIKQLSRIEVRGLMCMPPFDPDPENSRKHFVKLRKLMEFINRQLGMNLDELSMGTSFDYHIAIQEGATFVRIGTAITGERK